MTTSFTPVRTHTDLEAFWRSRIEPLGFARRALWIAFVTDDDEVCHQLVEIGDLPRNPVEEECDGFARLLSALHEDVGVHRFAFLLARPGRGGARSEDRAWASALVAMTRDAGVRCEPIHLATDDVLAPIALDDLAG